MRINGKTPYLQPTLENKELAREGREANHYARIVKDLRTSGQAWATFLLDWQLFLDNDEVVTVANLLNLGSMAVQKKGQLRKIKVKDVVRYEWDFEYDRIQEHEYASDTLAFFWCSPKRLRNVGNLSIRREKNILLKLKKKGIVKWKMVGQGFKKHRYLCVDTVQIDHWLQCAWYMRSVARSNKSLKAGTVHLPIDFRYPQK